MLVTILILQVRRDLGNRTVTLRLYIFQASEIIGDFFCEYLFKK